MDSMHYFSLQITVTRKTHAIKRDFLIWMTSVRQATKRRCSCALIWKYTFICDYWWARQSIHITLIAVDRYLAATHPWGIKRFQTRRNLACNRFISYSSQLSIYNIKVCWILIIFNVGIPIQVRWHLYIETARRFIASGPHAICFKQVR